MKATTLLLCASLTACSFSTVRGGARERSTAPSCTESYGAPATDALIALALATAAIFKEHQANESGDKRPIDKAAIATSSISADVFAISAIVGAITVAECRRTA